MATGSIFEILINDVEIIDLESPTTTCDKPANYPKAVQSPIGGFDSKGNPLICGGLDESTAYKECFAYKQNQWVASRMLTVGRAFSGTSPSPYPNRGHALFVTGGANAPSSSSGENSIEALTELGWESVSVSLPVYVFAHCTILVNATTILLIGGNVDYESSSKTYFFNSESETWTEGPSLNTARFAHACAKIMRDENGSRDEFSIIIVGGLDEDEYKESVEVLDAGSDSWRFGPSLFPIAGSQMVEMSDGSVVLVGGITDDVSGIDGLYQLDNAGPDSDWRKLPQKLQTGRYGHTAFLVPDEITNCN